MGEDAVVRKPALSTVSSCSEVPLVVFKREKEIARKLEFDGLYITEQIEKAIVLHLFWTEGLTSF